MGLIVKLTLAIFILLAIQDESSAARILALCPIPSISHFKMCGSLTRHLASKGHQVDVVSPYPLFEPRANYKDISIAKAMRETLDSLPVETARELTYVNTKFMIHVGGTQMCEFLRLPEIKEIIRRPPENPPYDLVINELFASECWMAFGRLLKVPVVGLVVENLKDWMNEPLGNPASAAFVPSTSTAFSQHMDFPERVYNVWQSIYLRVRYWHTIQSEQKGYLERRFGYHFRDISEVYKNVALVLVNSYHTFDPVRPLIPGIVEVGGLHLHEGNYPLPPNVEKWLNESEHGCIYFSFGNVDYQTLPENLRTSITRAFARIRPVRVLMRLASPVPPNDLTDNVMPTFWVPQSTVLQHKNVVGFITTCGFMSIVEAVSWAVPMVGVPLFSDHYPNMRRCVDHGIMAPIDHRTVDRDIFTRALKQIIYNETYSKNSKRMAKLYADRPMTPMQTATFWIEYVLRNGNVLKSPARGMPWWKMELLDVYGFSLFAFCAILYLIVDMVLLLRRSWMEDEPDVDPINYSSIPTPTRQDNDLYYQVYSGNTQGNTSPDMLITRRDHFSPTRSPTPQEEANSTTPASGQANNSPNGSANEKESDRTSRPVTKQSTPGTSPPSTSGRSSSSTSKSVSRHSSVSTRSSRKKKK